MLCVPEAADKTVMMRGTVFSIVHFHTAGLLAYQRMLHAEINVINFYWKCVKYCDQRVSPLIYLNKKLYYRKLTARRLLILSCQRCKQVVQQIHNTSK